MSLRYELITLCILFQGFMLTPVLIKDTDSMYANAAQICMYSSCRFPDEMHVDWFEIDHVTSSL